MSNRLREGRALLERPLEGDRVEVDETYIGGKECNKHAGEESKSGQGTVGKLPVIRARSRDDGSDRAELIQRSSRREFHSPIRGNATVGTAVCTDNALARQVLLQYAHERVNRCVGEYIGGRVRTNGIESFWSMLKRGYAGVAHQCRHKHLRHYLHSFSAFWNMSDANGSKWLGTLLGAFPGGN